MKCPNCRCVISDTARVCRYCGYILPSGRERTLTVREAVLDRRRGSRAFYGDYYSGRDERAYYSGSPAYYGDGYGRYDGYDYDNDAYGYDGACGRGRADEYFAPEPYAAEPYRDVYGFEYDDGYRDGYLDACGRSRQSGRPRSGSNKDAGSETVSPAFLIAVLALLLAVLGLLGFAVWNLM